MIPQDIINYIQKNKIAVRYHQETSANCVYVLVTKNVNYDEAKEWIDFAIKRHVKYIIIDQKLYTELQYISEILIPVESTSLVWAFIANLLYTKITPNITAVTGTSGKTTVAYMVNQISAICGGDSIYIGTVGAIEMHKDLKSNKLTDTLTTPDIMQLRKLLNANYSYGCIEASSHGIDQNRIAYLPIKVAAFTNLSLEHLDYHHNMQDYFEVKKKLFLAPEVEKIICNIDDSYAKNILTIDKPLLTYGSTNDADLQLLDFIPQKTITFKFYNAIYTADITIIGHFNAYNLLCAIGISISRGFDLDIILKALPHVSLPPGRLSLVKNILPEVYIDSAHKPDALEKVLLVLQEYRNYSAKNKIWVIFGCGGNRDIVKRSIMGKIASIFADKIIITDDNPRNEQPEIIRRHIISGITKEFFEIANRQLAIEFAMQNAMIDDIILIAGKGHEEYQIIDDKHIPFSDAIIVKNFNRF